MTHEDAGHYAAKHDNIPQDPKICAELKKKAVEGCITCADMHRIAGNLGILPKEAGVQADLLELRLMKCSMGLFGYGPGKKLIKPGEEIPPALEAGIMEKSVNGRISCRSCWDLAKEYKVSKVAVASACETLGLRIKPCQLGAF